MADKASRLLRIYSRLRRGPVTIEIIRDWANRNGIDVSERQLYRDLKEIENCISLEGEKIIVYEGEKNRKVWKIEFNERDKKLPLFDIHSFFLLKNFSPLTLISAREVSLEKVEALFYEMASNSGFEKTVLGASNAIKSSHFYEYPYEYAEHQLLENCIWAVQNQRKIKLNEVLYDHTSLAASVKFPLFILPLQILYHRGCIHLCGIEEKTMQLIILALEQIKGYDITNNMFDASLFLEIMQEQLNKRFGVTENIDKSVYDIAIEFSASTGDFVKNHFWHHSQQFKKTKSGNWIMKLHCGINRELVGWIFQWMNNAKSLKPVFLKKLVEQKLKDALELYNSDSVVYSNNIFRAP